MGEQEENGEKDELRQHTGHVFMLQRKKKNKVVPFEFFPNNSRNMTDIRL
jgi:hypothetical protein